MSSSPTRPWAAGSAHAPFPLSRIHRLLRPLRTSLASLKLTVEAQEARKSSEVRLARERNGSASRIYEEPKGSRKRKWDDAEFGSKPGKGGSSKLARSRGRPRLDHHGRVTAEEAGGSEATASSPLFKGLSSMTARVRTTYGRRLLRQSTSWGNGTTAAVAARMLTREEMAVREKVERVVESYANILDAVMELEAKPRRRIDRLAVMAARVVGKMLEEVVAEEVEQQARELSPSQVDGDSDDEAIKDTSAAEDEETRAALVDEWYDAVPSHFRRCVIHPPCADAR